MPFEQNYHSKHRNEQHGPPWRHFLCDLPTNLESSTCPKGKRSYSHVGKTCKKRVSFCREYLCRDAGVYHQRQGNQKEVSDISKVFCYKYWQGLQLNHFWPNFVVLVWNTSALIFDPIKGMFTYCMRGGWVEIWGSTKIIGGNWWSQKGVLEKRLCLPRYLCRAAFLY